MGENFTPWGGGTQNLCAKTGTDSGAGSCVNFRKSLIFAKVILRSYNKSIIFSKNSNIVLLHNKPSCNIMLFEYNNHTNSWRWRYENF